MSIEFSARIVNNGNFPFEALAIRLERDKVCLIENLTPEKIQFRWLNSPRRDVWTEDGELLLGETDLMLIFHSSTEKKRRQVIAAISVYASDLISEPVVFDET